MTTLPTRAGRSRRARGLTAVLAVSLLSISGCSTSVDGDPTEADGVTTGGNGDSPRDLLPSRIVEQGHVSVVADTSFGPPWIFNPDDAPEEFDGIDPTLARAIFEDVLGVDVKFVALPFDGIIPSLSAGRYDLAFNGMSDTAEREKQINMVHYVDDAHTLVVAEGNPLDIGGVEDLCGLTVSVVTGTHEAELAERQAEKCDSEMTVSKFPATGDVYLAIKSGRADATINGYAAAVYQDSNQVAGFAGLMALSELRIGANPLGIGLPKSDPELADAVAAALNQMIEDGTYQQILEEWNVASGALDEAVLNEMTE